MRNRIRRTALAATAATAVLILGACSSQDDAAPKVAGNQSNGNQKPQDDGAVRQAWVNCMHKQGQTDVTIDKDGNIVLPAGGVNGRSSSTADDARKVCDAQVPGIQQVKAKNQQKSVDEARAFVACARKNGYADIPDPDPTNGVLRFSAGGFSAPKWEAVQPACGNLPLPGYTIG